MLICLLVKIFAANPLSSISEVLLNWSIKNLRKGDTDINIGWGQKGKPTGEPGCSVG